MFEIASSLSFYNSNVFCKRHRAYNQSMKVCELQPYFQKPFLFLGNIWKNKEFEKYCYKAFRHQESGTEMLQQGLAYDWYSGCKLLYNLFSICEKLILCFYCHISRPIIALSLNLLNIKICVTQFGYNKRSYTFPIYTLSALYIQICVHISYY